jgi:cytochrome b pre-mRNA-processing protein 3
MDHNLRELGISDQGVPRQMRRVVEAFYGRAQAYDAALAESGEGALAEALARNVYAEAAEHRLAAAQLAAYVRQAVAMLETQSLDDLARGDARFPSLRFWCLPRSECDGDCGASVECGGPAR